MKSNFITVTDTNVLIASQYGSENSPNKEYLKRWQNKEFIFLYSEDIMSEYFKKFKEKGISKKIYMDLLSAIMFVGKKVAIKYFHFHKYPSDEKDIPFLLCALNGEATHLITYDKHLKELDDYYALKICETLEFLFELKQKEI